MYSLRWRRHWRLVALAAGGTAALLFVFGNVRITAITSSERADAQAPEGDNIDGRAPLFDDSGLHDVVVTFDAADYDRMLETFRRDGSKEFIEASITIDGTTIDSVGLRLKGNSTLFALGGRGPGRQVGAAGGGQFNGGPVGGPPQGGGQVGGGPGGGTADATRPETLPWLISFDEYVKGQRYQGYEEVAIRPITSTTSALNEALALSLIAMAGEASEKTSYSSLVINGSAPTLRLLLEIPGDQFAADNFDTPGVLYKSLSTGRFAYLGEDPLAYDGVFKQITRKKQQDMAPVIDLLRWVTEASDEEFAADLGRHVDIESLARYIALQSMLGNFDDMSGPGQNYYLWYDLDTQRFTVVVWDMNLALSGGAGAMARGGQQFPVNGGAGGAGGAPPGAQGGVAGRGGLPQGQPGGGAVVGGGGQVPGGQRGGNLLKERFLAAPAFQSLYREAYADIHAALFGSNAASDELARLQQVVASSGLLDGATIEREAAMLKATLETTTAAGPTP